MRHTTVKLVFLVAAFAFSVSCNSVAMGQGVGVGASRSTIGTNSEHEATGKAENGLGFSERNPRYVLRPSDVLEIAFPISPEFNQTVTIQPDGYVILRGIGDLYVQGKSVPQLTEALHKAYGAFLHDPVIDVELKDFEKPYFTASGQFGRPGKYELRGDTTVAEAVALAGGFTEKAKHSEVIVFRRTTGGWSEAKRIDVKRMLANKDLAEDVLLRPGDLVYVPQNKISKIHSLMPSMGMGLPIP